MKEQFRRRRLPHWDKPGAIYFVTTCLEGSIPAQGLLRLCDLRDRQRQRVRPNDVSEQDWNSRLWKESFVETERWLDLRPAVRHLADERLANIVEQSLCHFAAQRYALWAYVVMPSHIHWAFEPTRAWVDSLGMSVDNRPP